MLLEWFLSVIFCHHHLVTTVLHCLAVIYCIPATQKDHHGMILPVHKIWYDIYIFIQLYIVEPPFGLRLLLPFWCRRGGVLVHGWCAEKENRGKGGSGKGKIGAGVGSCRSMDPVRIPSGPSRAPIFAFLGTAFGQSGSSRDPVGHQCREAAKFIKNSIFAVFLHVFGWFWLLPDRSKRGAKNSKIGARLDPDWPKAVPKNAKIGARLGPDWAPTGSRLDPDPVSSKKHLFP